MDIVKKITLSNFKTFKNLDIELHDFNVLIGANASGKSNFVQFFRFLRDIANNGLDNAISMQGGAQFLRNIAIGSSEGISLKIVSELGSNALIGTKKQEIIGLVSGKEIYELIIDFFKRKRDFNILKDMVTLQGEVIEIGKNKKFGQGKFSFDSISNKITAEMPDSVSFKGNEDFSFLESFWTQRIGLFSQKRNKTILEDPLPSLSFSDFFKNISISDFDPKLPKKSVSIIGGKTELDEDGNNLAIVLENILENKDKKRKLFNLLNDLLPFVEKFSVEKMADKSMHFKAQETYFDKAYLPASFMSDGTINITALIVALFIEEKPLVVIEEPERNIHPYLISKVVCLLKEASKKKQVIVTTHNPEVVKYAGIENILLVSRNKDGFTQISRPVDSEQVKIFMKNNLGVEDLYVQNLLGA